jgi:hypothetical protein
VSTSGSNGVFGSRSKRHMSPATTLKRQSYKYTHSIDRNLPISVPAKHTIGRRHWITHVQDCEESESSSESSESSESLLGSNSKTCVNSFP